MQLFIKLVCIFNFMICYSLFSQVNLAPSATATCNSTSGGTTTGGGWNWFQINNGTISGCGNQEAFLWTSSPPASSDFLNWKWNENKTINKIIFYNAQTSLKGRTLTGCTVQYWNGVEFVDWYITLDNQLQEKCVDSIAFAPIVTTQIRLTKLKMISTGQLKNPNWREIQIIGKNCEVRDTLSVFACNQYTYKNRLYTVDFVYSDTFKSVIKCDSISTKYVKINSISKIKVQPITQFVLKNQSAEFFVLGINPYSQYRWQGNDNNGSNWFSLFDAGPYTGVNTNTLKVKDINAFLDRYAYRCFVSDSNCTEISNVSSLNICPEIIQQPVDRYNGLNAHVYFEVKVDFENVNYQWQVNTGLGFVDLLNDNLYNGVKSNRLDVYIQDKAQKNNLFRCIITKYNCVDTTFEVKLHLLEKTNPNPCNSQSLSSVYPNPTNDFITLLVPSDLVGKEYKIVKESGKQVMIGIISKELSTINIKDYAAAVYFLRIGNEGLDCFRIIKLND